MDCCDMVMKYFVVHLPDNFFLNYSDNFRNSKEILLKNVSVSEEISVSERDLAASEKLGF